MIVDEGNTYKNRKNLIGWLSWNADIRLMFDQLNSWVSSIKNFDYFTGQICYFLQNKIVEKITTNFFALKTN